MAETANKRNYYYNLSTGSSLGSSKTDVHRLIQAIQDKEATQLLYGLDYDTNKIYLIERVLT